MEGLSIIRLTPDEWEKAQASITLFWDVVPKISLSYFFQKLLSWFCLFNKILNFVMQIINTKAVVQN